jgi:serine protease Do
MTFLEKMRRQKLLSTALILFTLSVGILIGTLVNTGVKAAKDQVAAPGAKTLVIPNPVQLSTAFSQLAKQLEPSVVNISTTYEQKNPAQTRNRRSPRARPMPDDEDNNGEDNGMNDFFFRFFGNPFEGSPQMGPRRSSALGSGVIIDSNGYILTNNHVVEKADRIRVKMTGSNTEYDAKVIGTDPETDLAVIKIDAHHQLAPAKVGNSDAVQVGDWAVAIGSPFGLQATVTAGIISAKERDLGGGAEHQFQKFLQTDAAINPGNSGGPLLNINGEVIGINTAIASASGGYQGVGFALPINTAAKVYNQIIKNGKVTRGAIGIGFREANQDLLRAYGATSGVFVENVEANGPAEKAGIKPEDIIVALDGKPIKDGQELVNRVSETPVGSKLNITVLRDKKKQDFNVTIGDRAQVVAGRLGRGGAQPNEPGKSESTPAKFGISIENLTQARKDSMGIKEKGGVLVAEVQSGSFAEDIGLMPNDVILSINRQAVESVDDIKRIQNTLKTGDAVAFHVLRANGGITRRGGAQAPEWTSFYAAGTMPNTQ